MSTPEILYNNLLKISQAGRGDGAIYAFGTIASPDKVNKAFALVDMSIMSDVGANANELFNGYALGFTISNRIYLVTDYTKLVIDAAVFNGVGLDDMTSGGTYTGSSTIIYKVEIDKTQTPDEFAWYKDGVVQATSVEITGAAQTLDLGVTIEFNATTGHTELDYWEFAASPNIATTFEIPNAEDAGDWTMRRTLYTDDFNVANPIRYGSNGQLEKKWIDKAANNDATIQAALPNLIDDGGFELNSLTDYWTIRGAGGTATVAVNAGSPILGTYDCKWNKGDQTFIGIEQAGKGPLRKGYTYGIINKTGGDGGVVTDFRISLEYVAGVATNVPVTFTKINSGDDIATANIWKPAITDAEAWDEITFVVGEDLETGAWKLVLDQYDATDLFGDQIYIWEIGATVSGVDQPDTFIVAGHNFAGGFPAGSDVRALRCQPDLSSYDSTDPSDDMDILIDLDADVTVLGSATIYETFTASTAIFPIHEITLAAVSGKTWEAAEIWIGKRWSWDRFLSGDWEPVDQDIQVASSITIGGHKRVSDRYQQRLRGGTIATLDDDETARWESFIAEVGLSKPFWYYIAAIPDLGLAGEIIFMRNRSTPRLPMNADRFRSANYDFEEVL